MRDKEDLVQKILLELMVASSHIDHGSIEPHELRPEKIANDLDPMALAEIKLALRFASDRAPIVMRNVQESARRLITILEQRGRLQIGESFTSGAVALSDRVGDRAAN